MRANLTTTKDRTEFSAEFVLAAVLAAGFLTKLGFGWWAIGLMAALCLVEEIPRWRTKRNPKQADDRTRSGPRSVEAVAEKADLPLAA